MDVDILLTQEF